MTKTIEITEEQAKQMYDSGVESLRSIANSNFPDLFHEEKKWKDFGNVKGYYINSNSTCCESFIDVPTNYNKNLYPTKEEAERELALIQLRQWRDKANGEPLNDWCDWNNENQVKHVIAPFKNTWVVTISSRIPKVLTFKTHKIRDQFIKDHKSLIDKAFNIISEPF